MNKLFVIIFFLCSLLIVGYAQESLPRRAWWGVDFQDKDGQVVLSAVTKGSPFEIAGAKTGDIILAIDHSDIHTSADFRTKLTGRHEGDALELIVQREGEERNLTLVAQAFPYEKAPGVIFEYGSFITRQGDHLRTIISRPEKGKKRLPAILFIQWLSCDPVDAHPRYKDGNIQLIHDLSRAGFLVVRTEKPGVGDSKGKACNEYGFEYELNVHREALENLKNRSDVDIDNIFLFGSSMGGTMAPIIAQNQKIKGLIVTGCYYKTWYEHMLEIERRISFLNGENPEQTWQKMRLWSEFYSLYLNDKQKPGQIITENAEFRKVWQGSDEHQYGRHVSYFMEAQEHNIPAYWSEIHSPVLVIYGEYDWIMSRDDHLLIAEAINKKHEGYGTMLEVAGADHSLLIHPDRLHAYNNYSPDYDESLSDKVITWIKRVLAY